MEDKKIKGVIAYGLAPHEGGTTTFYRNFARGLRARGWRVFSVCAGAYAAGIFDARFGDEGSVLLTPQETELVAQVRAFLQWVEREQVDIVIPNCENTVYAALPHLPGKIRYINICHTVVRSAYINCTIHLDRLSCVVAINNRQMQEFPRRWGVPQEKLHLIPHGVDLKKFLKVTRKGGTSQPIRLVYLGRLEDMDKGVLFLPAILAEIKKLGVPFTCSLIGSGPDAELLKAAVARRGLEGGVTFYGQAAPDQVPGLLSQADIFLMPSRFEGFGFSLVEAMAAGCVPLSTNLQGVTDMIIENGVSGFLCTMGRVKDFAEKIAWLHQDRNRLARMSGEARKRVAQNFSLERMAADYDELFTKILSQPPLSYTPKELSKLTYPQELRPTWRTRLPLPLKNLARTVLYRCFGRYDI